MSSELKKLYIAWAVGGKFSSKQPIKSFDSLYRIDYCIPILGMHGISSVWMKEN